MAFLDFLRRKAPAATELKCCETCSRRMEAFVNPVPAGGTLTLTGDEFRSGVGAAEQCWECGRVYCADCYPARPRNMCVCGRGRDAVRRVGRTVFVGSMRLVKVRYL